MTEVMRPAEPATPSLPWPGSDDDAREPSGRDLVPMRDDAEVDAKVTSLDLLPVRDAAPAGVADTSQDLLPVLDVAAVDVSDTSAEPQPERDAAASVTAPTSLDLLPVRGGAAAGLTDTAFDLIPVPDSPERQADGHPASASPMTTDSWQLAGPRRLAVSRRLAGSRPAWRLAADSSVAGIVLATTVPLCLLQVPFAALPRLAGAATTATQAGAAQANGSLAVLRAASMALPFAVAAAPLAALAVRRFRAWPVLLTGLIVIIAGDTLAWLNATTGASAATAGSGGIAAVVAALHGIGAGLVLPATVAVVTERAGLPRRLLASWWAVVTVSVLAVLPALAPSQATSGWLGPLGPVPLLTVAALGAVILYRMLAGGPVSRRADHGVGAFALTPAERARLALLSAPERARLALLTAPAAALGVIAVAVTYRPGSTIVVAAVCAVAALLLMVAVAVHRSAGDGFGVPCAVAGFVLVPAAAALAALRAMAAASTTAAAGATAGAGSIAGAGATAAAGTTAGVGATAGAGVVGVPLAVAAVTGAIAGGVAVLVSRGAAQTPSATSPISLRPRGAGPLLVAAALVSASIAGPFASTAVLAMLVAATTAGLAAALARPAGEARTASAMAGTVVLAGAALAGYLAAAAIRVKLAGVALATAAAVPVPPGAVGGPGGPGAVPHTLVTALGWWELLGAAIAVTIAIVRYVRSARARTGTAARREPHLDRRGSYRGMRRMPRYEQAEIRRAAAAGGGKPRSA